MDETGVIEEHEFELPSNIEPRLHSGSVSTTCSDDPAMSERRNLYQVHQVSHFIELSKEEIELERAFIESP